MFGNAEAGWAETIDREGIFLMSPRPEVVQKIRLLAFDAVRADILPEDTTFQERAEGLISFAMSLMRYHTDPDSAVEEGRRLVEKYRDLTGSSYFG